MNSVLSAPTAVVKVNSHASNSSATPIRLSGVQDKPVFLDFDGGALSSDAGVLLLRQGEKQIGLINAQAEVIDDPRDPRYVKHTITDLLAQRIAQTASGYEDADDKEPELMCDLCETPFYSHHHKNLWCDSKLCLVHLIA